MQCERAQISVRVLDEFRGLKSLVSGAIRWPNPGPGKQNFNINCRQLVEEILDPELLLSSAFRRGRFSALSFLEETALTAE